MCQRACWPTPDDARRLIAAGHGPRLMLDRWVGPINDMGTDTTGDVLLLAPAEKGREGREAAWWPGGGCVMQRSDGLCELHDAGLKPTEGRVASCKGTPEDLHRRMASTWDNPEARTLVAEWRRDRA
jgi:hypothetical protein